MDATEDRLSKIAALRPNPRMSNLRAGGGVSSHSEKLLQLLEGENGFNRLGRHICVRSRWVQPTADVMDPKALQLITPGFMEAICDSGQWLFLDTETTGLAGGTGTYAFLVGLGWWESGGFVVEQYFMRDHGEEPSLLLAVLERLAERRVLVTFNGKSFDWPLLQTRYQMTRVGAIPEPLAHLDLLHPARQLWRLSLKSVALAQLERHVLKLDRGPDIPSETIPQRYFDFLRGGSSEAIAEVFRHNQLDLCGLASLALHMIRMLADPENGDCGANELFGISRLLQRRGEGHRAEQIFQKALDGGLPRAAERVAQREMAIMAKRERNFELSNALWEKLLDDSIEGLRAYEQLAIHYEHHASLPQKAAALSREALIQLQGSFRAGRLTSRQYQQWHASFQHRLNRNVGKTKNSESRIQNPE
jgi:uncharacterized protein YprB with RNaseH-like and TPR domain